ncbi:MAG: ATP-grasp domain-containing protein [Bacteroidaceae bacterium]|nr:ATP-grasp domain-containing protein [Bacteroidaceae bacterium]
MKKLLVLAAGILQIPVIKKAREMGYYVIAADGDANAVGLKYADKGIVANITDEKVMLGVAREEQVDGVIHPCSEVSMSVMGYINDTMGLSGISKLMAWRATNKHLMREAFEKYGAPSPQSYCTIDANEAWHFFCDKFDTNAILKPSRNSGSRGIAKIERGISREKFLELYGRAFNESRDKQVLIEQFIEGPEFSVEIIVWNNAVNVLTVTDKKTTGAPYFVELGHNQPSVFPTEIVEIVKNAAIDGVKALELNNCACHAEIKVENGRAYIMEIGARLGGDFISTELTHLSTGIDMVAAAIDVALGTEPYLEPKEEKHGVCIRYFCPKPGRLMSIEGLEVLGDAHVYLSEIYCKVGDNIHEVKSSLDRSGHVIVVDDTPQQAIERAEKILNKVFLKTQ